MAIFGQPDFCKGMTYALFWSDVSHPAFFTSLDRLAETGCNWVALAVGWWQKDAHATDIAPHPQKTPPDAQIEALIDHIHSLGMKVLLKPFVDAWDESWRGTFEPPKYLHWFKSYETFITHYARLAQRKKVALFSVGCENKLGPDKKQNFWREIIEVVRLHYRGPLTYAANFNGETSYQQVRFWDLLDFVGIDAYFSVAQQPESSAEAMALNWKQSIAEIQAWRQLQNIQQPVLFTEIGICSYKGAAMEPWAYPETVEADEQEQANYYQAFFEAFQDCSWLSGLFWWWWDNPSTGDFSMSREEGHNRHAISYTPQGKAAEEVIRRYFV